MAGFFDKLTANVTNVSRIGIQKAKNMSEANSLGNEQKSEKRNIQNQYAEIGRQYYEQHKNDPDAMYPDQIASIIASEKRIEELEVQIAAVRAREPELVEVPDTTPAPKPAAAPAPTGEPTSMVCMQCGSTYGTDKKMCTVCNEELVPQYGGEPVVRTEPNSTRPETSADEEKPNTLDVLTEDAPKEETGNADALETDAPKADAFCPYCGKPVEADAHFCSSCGKTL